MNNILRNDFEPISAAEWKQKIQFDLKGADYNETLLTNTNEGIVIKPFYHQDNFEKLAIPETQGNFNICQHIILDKDTSEANISAMDIVKRGADALKFIANEPFDIALLLNGLRYNGTEFHFQLNFLSEEFYTKLSDFLKGETVYFNIDIIGNLAKTGNCFFTLEEDFKIVEHLIRKNKHHTVLSIQADIYQNAGANAVQQLSYALAHANEYLTRFGKQVASKIQFHFAIGNNYFFEISKIRAFRYLYNLILKAYDTEADAPIFSEPSLRNKTLYDYNVNMLRTTTECMSAILGGSNTIANHSYDHLFHHANEFGNRIARNQLLILKNESYFTDIQDITKDSYYIESLTKALAEKALGLFKDIEVSGGFLAQLKKGTVQRKIAENASKEQAQFNKGELVLLGTNKYPNDQDKMNHELQISPFMERRSKKTLNVPIIAKRLSELLEQQKLKDEA